MKELRTAKTCSSKNYNRRALALCILWQTEIQVFYWAFQVLIFTAMNILRIFIYFMALEEASKFEQKSINFTFFCFQRCSPCKRRLRWDLLQKILISASKRFSYSTVCFARNERKQLNWIFITSGQLIMCYKTFSLNLYWRKAWD
jgi:hypothetical protein